MQFETWLRTDMQKGVEVKPLKGNLFSGDVQGNLIGVEVYDGGDAVTLSGTVSGYIVRGDGATVVITNGTLSGNKASVVLTNECYSIVGTISIVVKVDSVTVGACHGYVYRTSTDAIVDPGHVIPSLSELLAQIEACEEATEAATTATTNANAATTAASSAATNANQKATAANDAATAATNAATNANNAASKINNMTVAASGLAAGATPTATVTDVDGHKNIAFGIPKGDTGETPNLTIGTVTTLGEDDNATATITGTDENPVLNLGIPRGRTGSASGVYASNTPMSSSDSTTIGQKIGTMDAEIDEAVKVTAQTLTDAQKTQARTNIGAPSATDTVMVSAQTFTEAQKTQALNNIGAAAQAALELITPVKVTGESNCGISDRNSNYTFDYVERYAVGSLLIYAFAITVTSDIAEWSTMFNTTGLTGRVTGFLSKAQSYETSELYRESGVKVSTAVTTGSWRGFMITYG